MAMNRSELREKAMICLYQVYLYKNSNIDYDVKDIIKENVEVENGFVNDLVFGVLEKEKEIDKIINKYIIDWKIERLGKTDQAILRISTFELMFYDTPNIVAINEGIELAKKYSDEKISKMINGILDSILNNEVIDE